MELGFDEAAERIVRAHERDGDHRDLPIVDVKTWAAVPHQGQMALAPIAGHHVLHPEQHAEAARLVSFAHRLVTLLCGIGWRSPSLLREGEVREPVAGIRADEAADPGGRAEDELRVARLVAAGLAAERREQRPVSAVRADRQALETQLRTPEQQDSDLLFPSTTGGFRAATALGKPFARTAAALGLEKKISQRAMRRTFNDLRRAAQVEDIVARSISGHLTQEMGEHYSTVNAFAGALANAGINAQTAMRLTSHSDPTVHARYLRTTDASKRIPAAALPAFSDDRSAETSRPLDDCPTAVSFHTAFSRAGNGARTRDPQLGKC